jgi:hypothetical protein
MPLTNSQVAELVANQSHFGCGLESCEACYPVIYGCEFCTEPFPAPIANKEIYTCPNCEWVTNGSENY